MTGPEGKGRPGGETDQIIEVFPTNVKIGLRMKNHLQKVSYWGECNSTFFGGGAGQSGEVTKTKFKSLHEERHQRLDPVWNRGILGDPL